MTVFVLDPSGGPQYPSAMSTAAPYTLSAERHPHLVRLSAVFRARQRFAQDLVDRGAATFGDTWATAFERLLASMFPTDEAMTSAVKGYGAFAMQSMRLQAAFERDRVYKTKTHAQASEEVYLNAQHMMAEYLPGLLLSHYLWPHHYRQLQFFQYAFLDAMRVGHATSFVEVGIGTGLYSGLTLAALPNVRGLGLDISPSSRDFTLQQVAALGFADRYRVELRDVTAEPLAEPTQWLICVEVLEHLDDPVAFLKGLKRNMAPGARAFITAAINAAHADHIYLYRNSGEVLAQLQAAGFVLEQSFVGAAYKPSAPGVPVPEAVAFVVS